MAWNVVEFPFVMSRILVCEADTSEELSELRERAERKGWAVYAEGSVPGSDRVAVWLRKPSPPDRASP